MAGLASSLSVFPVERYTCETWWRPCSTTRRRWHCPDRGVPRRGVELIEDRPEFKAANCPHGRTGRGWSMPTRWLEPRNLPRPVECGRSCSGADGEHRQGSLYGRSSCPVRDEPGRRPSVDRQRPGFEGRSRGFRAAWPPPNPGGALHHGADEPGQDPATRRAVGLPYRPRPPGLLT